MTQQIQTSSFYQNTLSIHSLSISLGNPCRDILPYVSSEEFLTGIFFQYSWKVQIADLQLPSCPDSRFIPREFPGTCEELVKLISPTINAYLDQMDYNGFHPYCKIIKKIAGGILFKDCEVLSDNEREGSTCVGFSEGIVALLKRAHLVHGTVGLQLGIIRKVFDHAGVLLHAKDGWVLIEPSLPAKTRYFEIPYEKPFIGNGFIMRSFKPGNHPILTTKVGGVEQPFYFISNIEHEGGSTVMKNYVTSHGAWAPVTAYQSGQNVPYKVIKVYFQEKKVLLEDRSNPAEKKEESIDFTDILTGNVLYPKLKAFMENDFKTSVSLLHRQIVEIAIASNNGTLSKIPFSK